MADLTQIAASIATPSLSSALQQAQDLPIGQKIEAKIAQILSDGLIRLTSSIGTFDLKASHPALQPGVAVRLDVSSSGNVTLTVLPAKSGAAPSPLQPAQAPTLQNPAVITTLSSAQPPAVAAPGTYSATGQALQQAPVPQTNISSPALSAPAPAGETNAAPQQAAAPLPALSAALSEALGKQNSIAPLVANLDALTKLSKPLPQLLQAAIEDVLQSFSLSQEITPQAVEQAVKRSGVFFENALAQAFTDNPEASMPAPQDFKTALLKLETVLSTLTKENASSPRPEAAVAARPPPPRGTDAPEPQIQGRATLSAQSTQQDIVSILTDQTESALARVRVLQFASLPTAGAEQQAKPAQTWHLDIPLLINGQAAVIPLQIEREALKRETAEQNARRWRVRFAFDLSDLGAVHALLIFGSGMLDVTLWAEREQTYATFKSMAKDLHYALMDEDLDIAEIEFRNGSPREAGARAGSHLDTRT